MLDALEQTVELSMGDFLVCMGSFAGAAVGNIFCISVFCVWVMLCYWHNERKGKNVY